MKTHTDDHHKSSRMHFNAATFKSIQQSQKYKHLPVKIAYTHLNALLLIPTEQHA